MRPLKLTLDGVMAFDAPVTVDLTDCPPGLVVVRGPNGAGKTTLLESMGPAALWREYPSYPGPFKSRCVHDHAVLDLSFDYRGSTWRVLHTCDPSKDAGRGKTESFLYRDGAPATDEIDGKESTFKDAVALLLPDRQVFMASAFAGQKRQGNFRTLSKAARRDLFSTMLGNGHLQDLSIRARAHAAHVGELLDQVEAERATVLERRDRAQDLDRQADELRESLPDLATAVAAAEAELAQAEQALAQAKARQADLDAARARALRARSERQQDLDGTTGEITEAETEAAADDALISSAEEIEQAHGRWLHLSELHKAAADRLAAARADAERVATALRGQEQAEQVARRRLSELSRKVDQGPDARANVDKLKAAQVEASGLQAERLPLHNQRITRRAEWQRTAPQVRARASEADRGLERALGAFEQAQGRAALLGQVPCGGGTVRQVSERGGIRAEDVDCAACQFLVQAEEANGQIEELRAAVETAEARALEAGQATAAHQEEGAAIDELAARIAEIDQRLTALGYSGQALSAAEDLVAEVERAEAARVDVVAELARYDDALPPLRAESAELSGKARALAEQAATAKADLVPLANAEKRQRELEAALARQPGRTARLDGLRRRVALLQREIAEIEVPPLPEEATAATVAAQASRDDVAGRATGAREAHQEAREALAGLVGQRTELGDLDALAARLDAQHAALAARRAGFRMLERTLGRDGVQALDIDAAAPRVSDLSNDLLSACYGARFTVVFRTIQPAEGYKKEREVFDVIVHDGRSGGPPRPIEEFSGGEQVLLDEAVQMALALFNSERGGGEVETLWRDEADGALDEDNARLYPQLLRRAMTVGGFRNVWAISHRPDVVSQADALLDVAGGAARLEVLT